MSNLAPLLWVVLVMLPRLALLTASMWAVPRVKDFVALLCADPGLVLVTTSWGEQELLYCSL